MRAFEKNRPVCSSCIGFLESASTLKFYACELDKEPWHRIKVSSRVSAWGHFYPWGLHLADDFLAMNSQYGSPLALQSVSSAEKSKQPSG